jgi:predicted aldo/keto reductase-like oxidoreductase
MKMDIQKNHQEKGISRRGFIGTSLTGLTGLGLFGRKQMMTQAASALKPPAKIKQYRSLGRTGFKVSDISFGGGDLTNPPVLAAALDAGINYIDTAEHYMRGNSERSIGEVLKTRDRKSVFLTTKLNLTFAKAATKQDIKDRFLKCLERLQTDYADCLMAHMCTLAQVKHEPYHEVNRELKAEGKVRFSGLSNHGADYSIHGGLSDPMDQVVLAAAEDGRFDIVLFVYNFIKTDMGERILQACKAKGMGTTLMKSNITKTVENEKQMFQTYEERFKAQGKELPEQLKKLKIFTEERSAQTGAFLKKHNLQGPEQARDAAIKFCLSHPDVHCVCPTMNTFEDVEAFVALSGKKLESREQAMLAEYKEVYGPYYCRHACGRCEAACPHGVPVNSIMRFDHYFGAQRREKFAMEEYASLGPNNAARCANCAGYCEKDCPYGVPIQGLLIAADLRLTLA